MLTIFPTPNTNPNVPYFGLFDSANRVDADVPGALSNAGGAKSWAKISGSASTIAMGIRSNAFAMISPTSPSVGSALYAADAETPDGTLAFVMSVLDVKMRIAFRIAGISDFLFINIGATSAGSIDLRKSVAGVNTTLATGTSTYTAGNILEVGMAGDQVSVKNNGTTVITAQTVPEFKTSTLVGVMLLADTKPVGTGRLDYLGFTAPY
ncbi:hypothetical protein BH09ACT9_BH09ACT9_00860 [soil metagenome]